MCWRADGWCAGGVLERGDRVGEVIGFNLIFVCPRTQRDSHQGPDDIQVDPFVKLDHLGSDVGFGGIRKRTSANMVDLTQIDVSLEEADIANALGATDILCCIEQPRADFVPGI